MPARLWQLQRMTPLIQSPWCFGYLCNSLFFLNYSVVTFQRISNYFFLNVHQVLITRTVYVSFQPNSPQFYKVDASTHFTAGQAKFGCVQSLSVVTQLKMADLGSKSSSVWYWELSLSHYSAFQWSQLTYLVYQDPTSSPCTR